MASPPGAPPGGGDDQDTGGENPKRNVASYLRGLLGGGGVLGALAVVVSIITLIINHRATQEQLSVTRYAHAIQELGSERLPNRLTGIYELEQVARTSPDHYQLGMEILADYLRTVSLVPRGAGAGTPEPPDAAETAEIRVILKVLGRRDKDREPVRLELSGVNLRGLDLRGADLSRDDFSGADFEQADLSEADLREALLLLANLTEADLLLADLTGADLTAAHLTEASLGGADLAEANLSHANLTGADLRRVKNLTQEQLDVAVINEATLLPTELGTPEPLSSGLSTPPGSGTPGPPPP